MTGSLEEMLLARWPLAGDCRDHSGRGHHGAARGVDLRAGDPGGAEVGGAAFSGGAARIQVAAAPGLAVGAGDFTAAVRVWTPEEPESAAMDVLARYDPASRTGFTLGIRTLPGVTSSQPNYRTVAFGLDAGTEPRWEEHGRPGRAVLIFGLAVHAGELYAATCEPGAGESGRVYRFAGGTAWEDCGSPDGSNAVSALAVHRGELYAGTARYRTAGSALPESPNPRPGGGIFRYAGEGKWAGCGRLPGSDAVGGLAVHRGRLYATSLYAPAGLWRHEGGEAWSACGSPGGKRPVALGVFRGSLLATGYDEGHVYRYEEDGRWSDRGRLGESTQTYSFAVYGGLLHVGAWPGGRVYRYAEDGAWEDGGRLGEELEVMAMASHNGQLYAGTLPGGEVYRRDGASAWTRVGKLDRTPEVRYRRVWSMAEFRGRLFCGTLPSGRVHSLRAGACVTLDADLGAGWRHLAGIRRGERLELWVDGRRAAVTAAPRLDVDIPGPLLLGSGPVDGFQGRLRDACLYGRALDPAELRALASG